MTRCLAIAALLLPQMAGAADLAVSGSWSATVDASDLAFGAGSDLVPTHESLADTVDVEVLNTAGAAWRVDVRRSDTAWDPDVTVWVRRTSDGSGSGSIAGGSAWQQVSAMDATFFSGSGDRTAIGLQVRITGTSLSLPADLYATSLVYTVVEP